MSYKLKVLWQKYHAPFTSWDLYFRHTALDIDGATVVENRLGAGQSYWSWKAKHIVI